MKKRLVLIITLLMSVLLMACQEKAIETVVFSKDNPSIEVNNTDEISKNSELELSQDESINEESINEESVIVADYSICTYKTAKEVENFAKLVTDYFANEDWNSLGKIVNYPIIINDKYYADMDKFLDEDWSKAFSSSYIKRISEAQTSNLFCNWQGIALADGEIWINEIDSDLYVSSINYYDGSNVGYESSGIVGHWIFDLEMTQANLKEYSSVMEFLGSGVHTGGSLDINADGTFELSLAISDYMQGTYSQNENEIALSYTDGFGENGETTITYEKIDGISYIISEFEGEKIFWVKLAE